LPGRLEADNNKRMCLYDAAGKLLANGPKATLPFTVDPMATDLHGCTPTWWAAQHDSFSCSATTIKIMLSCSSAQNSFTESKIIGCMGCTSQTGPGATEFLACAKQLGLTGFKTTFSGAGGWDGVRTMIKDGYSVAVLYRTEYLPVWNGQSWGHWSYLYGLTDTTVSLSCPTKGWVNPTLDQMRKAIINHSGESGGGTLVFLKR